MNPQTGREGQLPSLGGGAEAKQEIERLGVSGMAIAYRRIAYGSSVGIDYWLETMKLSAQNTLARVNGEETELSELELEAKSAAERAYTAIADIEETTGFRDPLAKERFKYATHSTFEIVVQRMEGLGIELLELNEEGFYNSEKGLYRS